MIVDSFTAKNIKMAQERKTILNTNIYKAKKSQHDKLGSFYPECCYEKKKICDGLYQRLDLIEEVPKEHNEYLFQRFVHVQIGKPSLCYEDNIVFEHFSFNYCIFEECVIEGISFKNCSFSGSIFKNVNFERNYFEDCSFSVPVQFGNGPEVSFYYAPTKLVNCIFTSDFSNCNMQYMLIEKSYFTLCKLQKCEMQNSYWGFVTLSGVSFENCNLQNFYLVHTDIMNIESLNKSIVDDRTFIDYKIWSKKKRNGNVETESGWKRDNFGDMCCEKGDSLRAFSDLFFDNRVSKQGGEYFYRSKLLFQKGSKGSEKAKLILQNLLCGFGERPMHTAIIMFVSIFIFAILYMFSGVQAGTTVIDYSLSGGEPCDFLKVVSNFGKCLFFSVTTFSTVGYGNYVPFGGFSMFLSSIHMFIGIGLCALWTGCVLRKIAR